MLQVSAFLICFSLATSAPLPRTRPEGVGLLDGLQMWMQGPKKPVSKKPEVYHQLTLEVKASEVVFMAVGDWGNPGPKFDELQRGMVKEFKNLKERGSSPSFMVLLGDNFYPNGVVSPSDPSWNSHWYGGMLRNMEETIPWYTILGNHDHMGNRGQAQVNFHYSSLNDGRWQLPDFFYSQLTSFRGGSLCNVFVDVMKLGHKDQLSWMEGVLASEDCQKASWIIVYNHYPLVSAGKNRVNSKQPIIEEHILPLLQKYGVDLFLSGHDHDLQHLKYPGGPHVVVSGAGSQPRHSGGARIPERVSYIQSMYGFVSVKARKDKICFEYLANDLKKSEDTEFRTVPSMGFTLTAEDRVRDV